MSLENELVKQINSLQKQVDSLIKPEVGRWLDWTPVVTQGVVVTKTIVRARYIITDSGSTAHLIVTLTITSAGTAGTDIVISGIPVVPAVTGVSAIVGAGLVHDNGSALYNCSVAAYGANDFRFYGFNVVGGIGTSPNLALANTDEIGFQATYEIA